MATERADSGALRAVRGAEGGVGASDGAGGSGALAEAAPIRALVHLRNMAGLAMLGASITGSFGHHEDAVQIGAAVVGAGVGLWMGGRP